MSTGMRSYQATANQSVGYCFFLIIFLLVVPVVVVSLLIIHSPAAPFSIPCSCYTKSMSK